MARQVQRETETLEENQTGHLRADDSMWMRVRWNQFRLSCSGSSMRSDITENGWKNIGLRLASKILFTSEFGWLSTESKDYFIVQNHHTYPS